jgi:hypothetical protein
MDNNLAFGHAFKVMGATQQLMVRSLINLIEMISTSSHRYTQGNSAFTEEALSLMQRASAAKDPESARALQKEWADTCLKFSQSQTRMTMGFVEQFGKQVLGTMAASPFNAAEAEAPVTPPTVSSAAPEPAAAAPAPAAPKAPKPSPTPKPVKAKAPKPAKPPVAARIAKKTPTAKPVPAPAPVVAAIVETAKPATPPKAKIAAVKQTPLPKVAAPKTLKPSAKAIAVTTPKPATAKTPPKRPVKAAPKAVAKSPKPLAAPAKAPTKAVAKTAAEAVTKTAAKPAARKNSTLAEKS